jgi:transcriptional regulator with XRE-family HTH domain
MSRTIFTVVNYFLAIVNKLCIIYLGVIMAKLSVGTIIKAERDKAGWTQTELARRAGITPSALSQIESGDRYPSTVVLSKLSKALSVSMDFLLGEKKENDLHAILQNDKIKSLFNGFRDLSADDKDSILQQIEWLKARRKKSA